MRLDEILSIASLSVAGVGVFISLFLSPGRKRRIGFIIVFSILMVSSGAAYLRISQHQMAVERIAEEIIQNLGAEFKTFDQLVPEHHFHADPEILNKALDNLIREGKVGAKILEVRGDAGEKFHLRVYYLKDSATQK